MNRRAEDLTPGEEIGYCGTRRDSRGKIEKAGGGRQKKGVREHSKG
jgi:hypothetical protein